MVITPSRLREENNLRCRCGGDMGRSYSAPTVRKLYSDEGQELLQDAALSAELRMGRSEESKT